MNQVIAVFFMGYSGSGKDTQADLLRQYLEKRGESVFWVSTGDIMREAVKQGTFAGRMIDKKVMKAGKFAPPFAATWAWAAGVMPHFQEGQHIVFPSSPRTLEEAHDLDDFADFFDLRSCPLFVDVAREEAFRRLKARGRADDTDDVINHRLDTFIEKALPAVEYFRSESKNGLITIDGNPSDPLQIHDAIVKALKFA